MSRTGCALPQRLFAAGTFGEAIRTILAAYTFPVNAE
jgi:hypothetical protein